MQFHDPEPEVDGNSAPARPHFTEMDRAVMPGFAQAAAEIDLETQILFANLLASLQRVVTEAGNGDRAFLRDLRGVRPSVLSDKQREHVMRLAWRYRLQLPRGLRPAANPDEFRRAGSVATDQHADANGRSQAVADAQRAPPPNIDATRP